MITTGRDCGSAEWINKIYKTLKISVYAFLPALGETSGEDFPNPNFPVDWMPDLDLTPGMKDDILGFQLTSNVGLAFPLLIRDGSDPDLHM